MKRIFTYCLVLSTLLFGCVDIYNPEVDETENIIVVEARIAANAAENYVYLRQSVGFNDEEKFPVVKGGRVKIFDDLNTEYDLRETEDGTFKVNFKIKDDREYKIRVYSGSDVFESEFVSVPECPQIDSVYGSDEIRVVSSTSDGSEKEIGMQTYCDINNLLDSPYYRFAARKVLLYTYYEQIGYDIVTHYNWKSLYPSKYNIATIPDYSSAESIIKHPLFFLSRSIELEESERLYGWILIIKQHAIPVSIYEYYKDLSSQLGSDGKLFDPMYVEAKNNLYGVGYTDKKVLGIFEISKMKEYRFFVKYLSQDLGYLLKPIPYFYDISESGSQIHTFPDFWESADKVYPNE